MKKAQLFFLMILFSAPLWAQNIKINGHKNPVIAHRGAWKFNNLPENSIASLKQAIKLKCYGSEFDVHMTLDSVLVINHDPEFMQMPIAQTNYQTLLTQKLSNGETIPTLESYLTTGMKQKNTKLILELKTQKGGVAKDLKFSEKVAEMVKRLKAEPWVEYISFEYAICTALIAQMPTAKVAYLGGEVAPDKLKADGFTGLDYHYSVFKKNAWLAEAQNIGLSTNAWTVNSTEEMQRLLEQKVDYLTTNEPEQLFELLKNKKP